MRKVVLQIFFCLLFVSISFAQNLTVLEIMAEPSMTGMRVEGERLSPDGSKVAFLWNAEGKQPLDLYISETTRPAPARILGPRDLPAMPASLPESKLNYGLIIRDDFVKAREGQISGLEWSPDSKKLLFNRGGDLYVLIVGEKTPKRYTKTQSAEVAARFLDNNRIMFMQNGNLFVLDTQSSTLTQVSREANAQAFASIFNVNTNKAGSMVAYVVSDGSKQRALFVPNYLDEFVTAPTFRRGFTEQKVLVMPTNGSRDAPFEVKLPKAEGVSSFRTIRWAADGKSLIVDRNDKDTKRRQLFYIQDVGGKGEKTILITEETDDKWQAPLSALIEPHPKNAGQLVFGSEKDGYNHLYMATLEPLKAEANPSGEIRGENPSGPGYSTTPKMEQLTSGKWQVEWMKWMAGGDELLYSATTEGYTGREVFSILPAQKGSKAVKVTNEPGMKTGFQLDEQNDQPTLIYEGSTWNRPGELFAQKVCPRCRGMFMTERISSTTPESFTKRQWSVPKFLEIDSRDKKKIPAKIYLPAGHSPSKKYPMVIFVHGAGYLQNVIDGWNNYYREFLFNQILTQKGYVVLDIDYRGSAGYGRDWRTDVYDFLGGPDMDDHVDSIDYMVKNYGVNVNKVGVYGGSYGGFMAEMLITRAPDKVAAAAALRPVSDWKNYFASSPVYTAQRLGFPDKNPEAYKRSSPITYADKLERPLLILHGMVDDNVPAQDSMQYIEKLMRLGKTQYFEAMMYPSENHGFTRPSSWADEYERILAFFEKHLK